MSIRGIKPPPVTVELLHKWLKAGRGSGEGKDYQPWLTAEKTLTMSHSGKKVCPLTGRELRSHLSDGEQGIFLGAIRDPNTIDTRENFPLSTVLTLKICDEMGVPHLGGNDGTAFLPFTTDLLVTRKVPPKYVALTFKLRHVLKKPRDCTSLFVEHTYWSLFDVPFLVVTDVEVATNELISLRWLCPAHLPQTRKGPTKKLIAEFYREAAEADWSPPLMHVVRTISKKLKIDSGQGLELLKLLVWDGSIKCDLSRRITGDICNAVNFD
ncbi:hypothetical protein [Roseateles sp. LYH14W]|uniref:TnsA endonuclease N-terminal domain-containing protein n=1 Tax=Pelomonas parva TaxID=3299032 RepID=A0ABW7FE70_9BURK